MPAPIVQPVAPIPQFTRSPMTTVMAPSVPTVAPAMSVASIPAISAITPSITPPPMIAPTSVMGG